MNVDPVGTTITRPVISLGEEARADFVVRVYQHLLAAVVAFVAIEALFINIGLARGIYNFVAGNGMGWLLILGAFMVGQWFVAQAAADLLNPVRQYQALFAMAGLEALIFAPFLHYMFNVQNNGTTSVAAAALITAVGFAGLSLVAFITRKDLSFLRPIGDVRIHRGFGVDCRRGDLWSQSRNLVLGRHDRVGRHGHPLPNADHHSSLPGRGSRGRSIGPFRIAHDDVLVRAATRGPSVALTNPQRRAPRITGMGRE